MPIDDVDAVHAATSDLLTSAGHRYTRARRRIVAILLDAGQPMTIPQLLTADRRLAQSSTYRNLTTLERVGAVTRVMTFDDHDRFGLGERITRRRPHHMICGGCGAVEHFDLSPPLERSLDREFRRASRGSTFRIDRHRLDLLGTCARCA